VVVERRRPLGVEPRSVAERLAHLLSRRRGDQRRRQRERVAARGAPNQVTPGQDVEPLVVAANLQDAVVLAVQVQEVVRLDQRVVELDEAETALLETLP